MAAQQKRSRWLPGTLLKSILQRSSNVCAAMIEASPAFAVRATSSGPFVVATCRPKLATPLGDANKHDKTLALHLLLLWLTRNSVHSLRSANCEHYSGSTHQESNDVNYTGLLVNRNATFTIHPKDQSMVHTSIWFEARKCDF
eukprot:56641-Amphidinium_carterae.1